MTNIKWLVGEAHRYDGTVDRFENRDGKLELVGAPKPDTTLTDILGPPKLQHHIKLRDPKTGLPTGETAVFSEATMKRIMKMAPEIAALEEAFIERLFGQDDTKP